jgi:predicted CXXCH cytochrome family protein
VVRQKARRFTFSILASLAIFACPCLSQKLPSSAEPPSVAWRGVPLGPAGDYVGIERCRSCHKPEFTEFQKTVHANLSVPGAKYVTGCEACHGPGKAHSDAIEAAEGDEGKIKRALEAHPIFSFSVNAKITAALKQHPVFHFRSNSKENAAHCLLCHSSSKRQEFFEHSTHVAHGLSCDQCHATHLVEEIKDKSKGDLSYPQGYFFQVPQLPDEVRWLHNSLLKQPEPALCFTCHRTIQAQFALPVHHRVPEGLMKCTDCHNPHGTLNRVSLTRPNWESCVKCHVEKRGPYVFEHPAVKVEGCVICHNPHGSTNRMLLMRREGRQICLQCHTAFHGQLGVPHGRLGFAPGGECVRCHVAVHGSNFSETLLR